MRTAAYGENDEGVIELNKSKEDIVTAVQPLACKGCIWGRWEGVKQFCSMPECAKARHFF